MSGALVCPSCSTEPDEPERFCEDCGLPLVYGPGAADAPKTSELAERARKVRPSYAEGPLVWVAAARHQAEAELIQGLLLEFGIPSLARRTGGADVPDFLASGPREILVASSGAEVARELLGDPKAPRRLPPHEHPAWVRSLAVVLTVFVFVLFATLIATPLLD
jgi:hypothetical protein